MLLKKRVQLPPQPGQIVKLKAKINEVNKKAFHASHTYDYGRGKRSIQLKEVSSYLVLRHFTGTDEMFYAIPVEHIDYQLTCSGYAIDMLYHRARRKELLLSSKAVKVVGTFDHFLSERSSNEGRKERYKRELLDKSGADITRLGFL